MLSRAKLLFLLTLLSFESLSQQSLTDELQALNDHIRKTLTYPSDALQNGLEGIVHVSFKIDSAGRIRTSKISIAKSLSPSCDAEAIRVISLYNGKFRYHPANWPFIFPVAFALTDFEKSRLPSRILQKPLKAVIVSKVTGARDPNWTIYARKGLNDNLCRVEPGDTVLITGWASWSFFVQTRCASGYISYKAIAINDDLDSLTNVVEKLSQSEEQLEAAETVAPDLQVVDNFSSPGARLVLYSTDNKLYMGQCSTMTLAFELSDKNDLRLQFHDIPRQVNSIIDEQLDTKDLFISYVHFPEIKPQHTPNNGEFYTRYKLLDVRYCPLRSGVYKLPAVKLQMLNNKRNKPREAENLLAFSSSPFELTVESLPPGIDVSSFGGFKMIGEFAIKERIDPKVIRSGEMFHYRLTLNGNANTSFVEPPVISSPGLKSELIDVVLIDTIINNEFQSSRTFVYAMMAEKDGVIDFSDKVSFTFFSPTTSKVKRLSSALKIQIVKGDSPGTFRKGSFRKSNFLIAIDVSQSMMVKDYQPNRLQVVKQGLNKFLKLEGSCNVALIVFGGNAIYLNRQDGSDCYSEASIEGLNYEMVKSGTAIGDAIWLSLVSRRKVPPASVLVIIGDGDNTAGSLSPVFAAAMAKNSNMKIYTIGVGTKGLVPFGQYLIEDTFSDVDFRKIAESTGGEYYWAKDAEEITSLLKNILHK